MQNQNAKLVAFLALWICFAAFTPPASSETPFVDFSNSENEQIGVMGFPALEILPGQNEDTAMIVAREVHIQDNLTYSSGYFTPVKKFTPPPFFSFTIYGYHETPQWKEIESVNFKFGNQNFSAKPVYTVKGPDRDRTLDTQDSEYFESMIIMLPPKVAQQIADNNGVLVTTTPFSLYLPIPASKLDRFKQLVNSVAAISKNIKAKSQSKNTSVAKPARKSTGKSTKPKSIKAKIVAPGLPITEVFDDALGGTSLETELTKVSANFGIQAMAWTTHQGKKLKQPFTALLVTAVSAEPIWTNVRSVTLSFGAKRLRLTPNVSKSSQLENGFILEVMTVRVPYRDFLAMSKGGKFYITVGQASFEVNKWQATGIRELAKRISK